MSLVAVAPLKEPCERETQARSPHPKGNGEVIEGLFVDRILLGKAIGVVAAAIGDDIPELMELIAMETHSKLVQPNGNDGELDDLIDGWLLGETIGVSVSNDPLITELMAMDTQRMLSQPKGKDE